MRWDPRRGPVILGTYPTELSLSPDELVNVFGGLFLEEEERREGFYTISLGGRNILAYYSGIELNEIFGIILKPDENPNDYRGGLVRLALKIFKLGEEILYSEEGWIEAWNWIIGYPSMTAEQRLADIFVEEEARSLLDIMIEEGILTIDDVIKRLRGMYPGLSRDVITSYVHTFEALDIIATRFDEKALIERVYLLRDVAFIRKKPEVFGKVSKVIPGYEKKWEEFVMRYHDREWIQDRNILPKILAEAETYRVLTEFRSKGVISSEEVRARGWAELIEEKLRPYEIIERHEDKYYLFSDPAVVYIFPRYVIARVVDKLKNGEIEKKIVLEYLRILRDAFSR